MLLTYLQKREYGGKRRFLEGELYMSYSVNMCNNNHQFGYAPHIYHSTCRFCWGYKPLTFSEFIQLRHDINNPNIDTKYWYKYSYN